MIKYERGGGGERHGGRGSKEEGGRGRGREREGWKTDEEEQLWREGDWKERGVRILEGEMRADRGKVRR